MLIMAQYFYSCKFAMSIWNREQDDIEKGTGQKKKENQKLF